MTDTFERLKNALANRYSIESEIGVGGMATVYLAEDLKHKRKVAVKVLRPELAAVLGAERFVQEITTTANLQHPNILPLFDSGETDGFLYFWSADGRWLIMRVGVGASRDIYALRPGVDSVARPIVATEAQELSPTLSPDGRWLASVSIESGQMGVYVQPFPAGEGLRTAVSVGGASEPAWSHDGRELFFRSDTHLMAVDVEPDGEFRASQPRALFSTAGYWADGLHTSYAVGPDDESFYFVRRASGAGTRLVMVLNWFEELKAKLGN